MKSINFNWHKYFVIFITQMKNLLEYRMNIALKLFRPLLMTAVIGSLWMVLFRISNRDTIGGFDRYSFILYILIVRFVAVFSPGGASITEMNEEIRSGNLTMRLVRPVHYLAWLFSRNLPVPLVSGTIGLSLVTLAAWLFGLTIPTGAQGGLFILSVIAAIITQYAFYLGIGILSFWLYEVFPLERFYKTLAGLLSGELLPLTIFSDLVRSILQYLPFASMAFIPGGIYTGVIQPSEAIKMVASQYLWALVLWVLVLKTYQHGLKKFEAQGG